MIIILFLGFVIVVALCPSVLDSHLPVKDREVFGFHSIYILFGETSKNQVNKHTSVSISNDNQCFGENQNGQCNDLPGEGDALHVGKQQKSFTNLRRKQKPLRGLRPGSSPEFSLAVFPRA